MMRQPDADGRIPLTGNEYYAIREIFGMISALELGMGYLQERAHLKPGVWRDLKLVSAKAQSAVSELLRTVPRKKLEQITHDLEHTHVTVEIKPELKCVKPPQAENYVYVSALALDKLIDTVMQFECFACDKAGKDVKRCPVRKIIEDTFPYDFELDEDGGCVFRGCKIEHRHEEMEGDDVKSDVCNSTHD